MEAVFLQLLNMSITATWIALAIIVLRLFLKKAPKWIMGVLWGFVALRLICPFSFESVFSLIPSTETVPHNIVMSDTPAINSGIPFVNQAVNPIISNALSTNVADSVNPMQIITLAASVLWLAGVLAMLVYTVISYLRIRRKVDEAIQTSDGVWHCDRISNPFILGIIHPKIYLPSSMNDSDTDYVLSHEKAHLKRKDYIWKPLGFLLLTVYWFNPVLWLAYALLCRDIELACDEKVIKEMGAEIKKPYSEALINCSVPRKMIAACPLAFGEVDVKERVKSVLNYKKPAFWIIIVAVVTCTVTAVCLLTNPNDEVIIPTGKYDIAENIYKDGIFDYYMDTANAPSIEIDIYMDVYELNGEELLSGGLFKETKLTQENFGSLFKGPEIWQNNESAANMQKNNRFVWYMTWSLSENGIFPYMILQQDDGRLYIVYADVENGEAVCIRWIFRLELNLSSSASNEYDFYTCTSLSDGSLEPCIFLSQSDDSFSLTWSPQGSIFTTGKYVLTESTLTLKAASGSEYVFDVTDNGFSCNLKNSAFSALDAMKGFLCDKAIFAKAGNTNISPVEYFDMNKVIVTDIDGDGKDETCCIGIGPTSGLYTFTLSASENSKKEYFNIFLSESSWISFVKNKDGNVFLETVNLDSKEVRLYDISVKDGNIFLTFNGEQLGYWGEQGVNSVFA